MIFPIVIPTAQLVIRNDLKCFTDLHEHFFGLLLLQSVSILMLVWVPFERHFLVRTLDHAPIVFMWLYTQYFIPVDTVHSVHLLLRALKIMHVLHITATKKGHQKWR